MAFCSSDSDKRNFLCWHSSKASVPYVQVNDRKLQLVEILLSAIIFVFLVIKIVNARHSSYNGYVPEFINI